MTQTKSDPFSMQPPDVRDDDKHSSGARNQQDPNRPGAKRTGQEGQDMEGGKGAAQQPDAGRGNEIASSRRDPNTGG